MKYSKAHLAKEAIKHKGFLEKIPALFKMIKMWWKGEYKTKSRNIILPILGLIYVISPIDFLPEIALPVVGVLDDLALLTFIIPKLMNEVDKFLLWEATKTDTTIIDAEVVE